GETAADIVAATGSVYDDKNAGVAAKVTLTITVTDSNYAIDGGVNEYDFDAAITAKALTVTAKAPTISKVYDGTTTGPTVTTDNLTTYLNITGVADGEEISGIFGITSCLYDSKDVDAAKVTLIITVVDPNYTIDGGVYEYDLDAAITAKALTITASNATVVFDGEEHLITAHIPGVIEGDSLPIAASITLRAGDAVTSAKNADEYIFTFSLNSADPNYSVTGTTAVLTIKKASRETFESIIAAGTVFNTGRYVYDGGLVIPELKAFSVDAKYGISYIGCDNEGISGAGEYLVTFSFDVSDNFDTDGGYVVKYVIEKQPRELIVERDDKTITIINPIPGAEYRLIDSDGKATEWQRGTVFSVKPGKDYTVEMRLDDGIVGNYAVNTLTIESPKTSSDAPVYIAVGLVVLLILLLVILLSRGVKRKGGGGMMGMVPIGGTQPMPGYGVPRTANGLGIPPRAAKPVDPPKPGPRPKSGKVKPINSMQPKKATQFTSNAKTATKKQIETEKMGDMGYIKNASLYDADPKTPVERSMVMKEKGKR
ncbi:MAG: hypothetical protein LBQ40_00520, partial [Clostridiales bacterium]|nr:hypothetical protein [Clostridiales bacterium]